MSTPKRHIRFAPIKPSVFSSSSSHQTRDGRDITDGRSGEIRGKFGRTSRARQHGLMWRLRRLVVWEWLAIGFISVSTVLFLVAFNTNGWGVLVVNESQDTEGPGITRIQQLGYNASKGEYWEFGLWECCRHDGLCLGTRWPAFYTATRLFCVISLFGHMVTLLWFISHSLEKLVKYDVCAYSALISFVWFTAICLFVSVISFGTRWPVEFAHEFHGTRLYLSYSFYLCVTCCPLMIAAGAMILIYMIKTRESYRTRKEKYVTAEELLGLDSEGNINYV